MLQVWDLQRLPDLQTRSGTMGLWMVATGLVATATAMGLFFLDFLVCKTRMLLLSSWIFFLPK